MLLDQDASLLIHTRAHDSTCESCATCLFTRTRTSYHLVPGYFVPARVLMHSTRVIVFALMVVYRVPGYVSVADIVADIVRSNSPTLTSELPGTCPKRF